MAAMVADMDEGIGVVVLINGYVQSYGAPDVAMHMLRLLRAGLSNQVLPGAPVATDPASVDNAAEYAGSYRSGDDRLVLSVQGGRLTLNWRGSEVVLQRRGEDSFYVPQADMEHFLLEFGRDDGRVVEAFHGPDWFVGEGYASQESFDYPPEWESFAGHYRTYNYGLTNFRIVLRKGVLQLMYPGGGHDPLIPLGAGLFRIGEDPRSPETMRFDSMASGQTLRAIYSGCPTTTVLTHRKSGTTRNVGQIRAGTCPPSAGCGPPQGCHRCWRRPTCSGRPTPGIRLWRPFLSRGSREESPTTPGGPPWW